MVSLFEHLLGELPLPQMKHKEAATKQGALIFPTCRITGRTNLIQAKFTSIASLFSKLGLLAAVKSIVSITALKLHYSSRITSQLLLPASFKCLLHTHLTQSSLQPREEMEKEQNVL